MIGPFGLLAVGIALVVWIVWPHEPLASPPPARVRILSGAHRDHLGDLIRVRDGKALVWLQSGVCVWVPANEWVRIAE